MDSPIVLTIVAFNFAQKNAFKISFQFVIDVNLFFTISVFQNNIETFASSL